MRVQQHPVFQQTDSVTALGLNPPKKTAEASSGIWGKDGLDFADVLDIVNPLQHLPVVSNIYRALTHDEIADAPRALGGALFGGVAGFAGSIVNSVIKNTSDKDIGEHIIALFQQNDNSQTADADAIKLLLAQDDQQTANRYDWIENIQARESVVQKPPVISEKNQPVQLAATLPPLESTFLQSLDNGEQTKRRDPNDAVAFRVDGSKVPLLTVTGMPLMNDALSNETFASSALSRDVSPGAMADVSPLRRYLDKIPIVSSIMRFFTEEAHAVESPAVVANTNTNDVVVEVFRVAHAKDGGGRLPAADATVEVFPIGNSQPLRGASTPQHKPADSRIYGHFSGGLDLQV